jgi:ATP-dependent Clp protease, protease subunit
MKQDHNSEHEDVISLLPSKYFETYIKLSKDRAIFLIEDFTKEMSSAITALLLYYDHRDPAEDITIYISSNGGDAAALTNIIDVIGIISAPVSTVNMGVAYSAGGLLLAAGAKGKRFGFRHSEVMLHGIQTIYPNLGEEKHSSSKNYLNFLIQTNETIMKMLAKNTGKSLAQVKKDCEKDMYFDSKAALQYGIIDEIIG